MLRTDLQVHLIKLIGSPAVVSDSMRSMLSVSVLSCSTDALRPPPGCRTRRGSNSTSLSFFISLLPRVIVVLDKPVARLTIDTPPYPISLDFTAANQRFWDSVKTQNSVSHSSLMLLLSTSLKNI